MKNHTSFVLFPFSLTMIFASPEKPNFQDDIIPVFEQSCNSCHNPDKARGGLDLTSINAIIAGGSSGEVASPGDPDNSLLYLLPARLQEPHMPPRGDKIEKSQLTLIKNWIAQGMLPTASGKPMQKKKSSVNLALGKVTIGKPEGPPPMPKYLPLEPAIVTERSFAPSAMAAAPWSPLVALAGQKQVLLYNTDNLQIAGILPYEEGFIESLNFSRNGKLIIASGGRGGKSGRVVGWEVETGRKVLTVGEEQDSILTADITADQSLVAIGGTTKLVKVFDLASDEVLYKIKKHSEWVTQVSFSPDGILLATGDRNGGIHVWEAKTGNPFYTLVGHKEEITSLSWRADGNVLLSASEEGAVRTWEMINGKQVRTWNAHASGTLSAHFAQNGNIVTSGRDKTVKYWDGNGKGLRTISGFTDIVMEARLSHDASKIIAGDWSGKVGIWNSADGKSLGELNPNPPTLSTRVSLASTRLNEDQAKVQSAQSKLEPYTQKVNQVNTQVAQQRESLQASEAALHASVQKAAASKQAFDKAQTALGDLAKTREQRQISLASKKKELEQANQSKQLHQDNFNKWNERTNARSSQLSVLKENHHKAKESEQDNADDSSYTNAVNKTWEAYQAMEKAFIHAREQMANHKAELEKFTNLSNALTQAVAEANKALEDIMASYAKGDSEKNQAAMALKSAQDEQSLANTKHDQVKKTLEETEKLLAQAQENVKGPAEELLTAQKLASSSQNNLNRWKAEQINLTRHKELFTLTDLQSELSSFDDLIEEVKMNHENAVSEVENAKETIRLLPSRISEKQNLITQSKSNLDTINKALENVNSEKTNKNVFWQKLEQLAKQNQQQAQNLPQDDLLVQASNKLSETLDLLKQDLSRADARITSKQKELNDAQTKVQEAELALADIMKLRESTPQVLKEKEEALAVARSKLDGKQKEYEVFKSKVDQQKKKRKLS